MNDYVSSPQNVKPIVKGIEEIADTLGAHNKGIVIGIVHKEGLEAVVSFRLQAVGMA